MITPNILILAAIIAYLLLVVGIGIFFANRNKSVSDFYLGGRKLGPFVTAMSAEASDMSSWLLMGLPGVAYACGIADAAWTAIGLAIGTYVNWLIVAKRLRKYSEHTKSTTVPEFFSNRFHDNRHTISFIAALVIIVFFIPYTGSGFSACGKLFSSLFDIDYHTAMIISAIVIVLYTTIGGFLAASTSDFIQSIVMTIALVVILVFGINNAGGFSAVIDNAKDIPGYLKLTQMHSDGAAVDYGSITIISTLAWGLGYFGMPHVLLRFMAIEDSKKLKMSRRIATVWVVISLGFAVFIGIMGNCMSAIGSLDKLEDSETIIIAIAKLISSHGALAAIIAGVILAGILAATMSTADSQLLAASSSASKDILTDFLGFKLSDKMSMIIARATVVVISIIAVIIAWNPDSSVFTIVSFAWAGFGAAFGPVVLFALFWKNTNKTGALAGMISGGVVVFIWKFLVKPLGGMFNIYELLPAFIVGCAVLFVTSLLTGGASDEVAAEFEAVQKEMAK